MNNKYKGIKNAMSSTRDLAVTSLKKNCIKESCERGGGKKKREKNNINKENPVNHNGEGKEAKKPTSRRRIGFDKDGLYVCIFVSVYICM